MKLCDLMLTGMYKTNVDSTPSNVYDHLDHGFRSFANFLHAKERGNCPQNGSTLDRQRLDYYEVTWR